MHRACLVSIDLFSSSAALIQRTSLTTDPLSPSRMVSRSAPQEKKTSTGQPKTTRAAKCVSRESNAGPIDGNDGFYH